MNFPTWRTRLQQSYRRHTNHTHTHPGTHEHAFENWAHKICIARPSIGASKFEHVSLLLPILFSFYLYYISKKCECTMYKRTNQLEEATGINQWYANQRLGNTVVCRWPNMIGCISIRYWPAYNAITPQRDFPYYMNEDCYGRWRLLSGFFDKCCKPNFLLCSITFSWEYWLNMI